MRVLHVKADAPNFVISSGLREQVVACLEQNFLQIRQLTELLEADLLCDGHYFLVPRLAIPGPHLATECLHFKRLLTLEDAEECLDIAH